jgi:hypothetical protein
MVAHHSLDQLGDGHEQHRLVFFKKIKILKEHYRFLLSFLLHIVGKTIIELNFSISLNSDLKSIELKT